MKANEALRPLAQDLINMGYTIYTFDENNKAHYNTYFFVGNDKVVLYVQYNIMGQTISFEYKPSKNNGTGCRVMDENPNLTAQDVADLIEEFTKDYSAKTLRKYNNLLDFKTLTLWEDAKDWFEHSWSKNDFVVLKND